ncbi:Do family serine endopeptidase [Buchnera aphidicola (Mindarus keteleerifoliae)]|uniref:Do family serine endopeptidase n=1 Tax=Buchnera aphidicola TaxID=9 RepID=UPI0031B68A44
MKKMAIVIMIISFLFPRFSISSNENFSFLKKNNISNENIFSLSTLLNKVIPTVVSIDAEVKTTIENNEIQNDQSFLNENEAPFCEKKSPFYGTPLCKKWNKKNQLPKKIRVIGSGVIINAEHGYIVTNNHVVQNANKIQVKLNDGRLYNANLIGQDELSDIALLKLNNAKNLIAIKMIESENLKVGDYTIAIGNPYGLGETVTSGIISALGRSGLNNSHYENFIQTDAAINKGNSGGALVNLEGKLIGINTAILSPDGGSIGIGFSIPTNIVKNITDQIIKYGHVIRGELGIIGTELTFDLSKAMSLKLRRGAFINQVFKNSSADLSGIKPGDIIISLNKKPIFNFLSLRAEIASLPFNSKIKIGLIHDEKIKTVVAVLKYHLKRKSNYGVLNKFIEGANFTNFISNNQKRVKVTFVKVNSSAFKLGFKKNDIILEVNKEKIFNLNDLKNIFEKDPSILVFKIQRENSEVYLIV